MLHIGEIPLSLFNISTLRIISLDQNILNGTLPDKICRQLPQLEIFSLSKNHFEGTIPPTIGNCTSLQGLYLWGNFFTGIPLNLYLHFMLLINFIQFLYY